MPRSSKALFCMAAINTQRRVALLELYSRLKPHRVHHAQARLLEGKQNPKHALCPTGAPLACAVLSKKASKAETGKEPVLQPDV